jgi:DNA (cytosine-5)-methyltransferase 1
MTAFYNEHDPIAAAWLRELIREGHIAPGVVDDRDIQALKGDDLVGFTQVHLFAGVGGWSLALRLAGWPDSRPVVTGSCPCQPWSDGNVWQGGGRGADDHRHLWPDMHRLIREGRERRQPCFGVIFGEQVTGAIRKGWLDGVLSELEDEGYACGAIVLPACSVGARHERKRIYWCADAGGERREGYQPFAGVPVSKTPAFAINGNPLTRAWGALDGDISGLLHCDGLSVVLERSALKGYGNAIVPQVAAAFVTAYLEAREGVATC